MGYMDPKLNEEIHVYAQLILSPFDGNQKIDSVSLSTQIESAKTTSI